jgi:hypothetical protein
VVSVTDPYGHNLGFLERLTSSVNYQSNIATNIVLIVIKDDQNAYPLLRDMPELFQTDFGRPVEVQAVDCCKLLHEYSVVDPPGHVDCWHTQHF